jgi:hypothetical protein
MSAMAELIRARAALVRMRDAVHEGGDVCGPLCGDYHAAMRHVTYAAEALGMDVQWLDGAARAYNEVEYEFVEEHERG